MSLRLSLKDVVHHGGEAVAFLAVGTYAFSSLSGTCVAYGAGKISYLCTKMLLDVCAPQMSNNTKRTISWGVSLLAGGSALRVVQDKVAGQSMSIWMTAGTTLGVTGVSIGVRALSDKCFKYLNITK